MAAAVNPQLAEVFAKSEGHLSGDSAFEHASEFGLSDAELAQLFNFGLLFFRHFEDQYFSDLPESDRLGLESQARQALRTSTTYSKIWELFKSRFDNRFQEFVDNLVREEIQGDDHDLEPKTV